MNRGATNRPRRLVLAALLTIPAIWIAASYVISAGPTEAEQIIDLQQRVGTLEAIHGIEQPTATPGPSVTPENPPTATEEPTAAPSATSTATATPEPSTGSWHAPAGHEHGAAPPAWAVDWSQSTYGHGIIYGGDETTPGEFPNKPEGFKGYSGTVTADDGSQVDVYARVHYLTLPLGRGARYHSTEWYFRDATGAVSHMQYWADFGDPATGRYSVSGYAEMVALIRSLGSTVAANTIFSLEEYPPREYGYEFWYAQLNADSGGWHPTFALRISDPLTNTAGAQTGRFATQRSLSFRWIAGGSNVVNIQGQPYLQRNLEDPRGWFCTSKTAVVTATNVSGPDACGADELPQFIAPTLPTIADAYGESPRVISGYASSIGLTYPN